MSIKQPYFPYWDGCTPGRESRHTDRRPNSTDYDQLAAEILAIQDRFQQPHIPDLQPGATSAEIVAAVNAILAMLRESDLILPP